MRHARLWLGMKRTLGRVFVGVALPWRYFALVFCRDYIHEVYQGNGQEQ